MIAEVQRLAEEATRGKNWKRWGPYLAERQWATVREDYSPHGTVWEYFPHDHARRRAYRWGEDGLLGITDRVCRLCFALALWNGKDPILKERLFGLNGPEGNHGEDVKECYYYLDSTPTHSYMKALYKYPQAAFPYAWLVDENQRRGRDVPEFELLDTGVFNDSRYFDVFAEYAKAGPDDVLIRITVANRGPDAATMHLLPTLWYCNTWTWGCKHDGCSSKPSIAMGGDSLIRGDHCSFGRHYLVAGPGPDQKAPEILFTENETNTERLFGTTNRTPYVKDAFHEYVVQGKRDVVNPKLVGTKAAAHYTLNIPAGKDVVIRLRLSTDQLSVGKSLGKEFDDIFAARLREADEFHSDIVPATLGAEEKSVVRQAYAGLLWSKQFYHYIVADWLDGDSQQPASPESRPSGRTAGR